MATPDQIERLTNVLRGQVAATLKDGSRKLDKLNLLQDQMKIAMEVKIPEVDKSLEEVHLYLSEFNGEPVIDSQITQIKKTKEEWYIQKEAKVKLEKERIYKAAQLDEEMTTVNKLHSTADSGTNDYSSYIGLKPRCVVEAPGTRDYVTVKKQPDEDVQLPSKIPPEITQKKAVPTTSVIQYECESKKPWEAAKFVPDSREEEDMESRSTYHIQNGFLGADNLVVGREVWALTKRGLWKKAEIVEQKIGANRSATKYKVKFNDLPKGQKVLPVHHLACVDTSAICKKRQLFVGARVAAHYDDQGVFSAIVVELPNKTNSNRFLVFFDDGDKIYSFQDFIYMVYGPQIEVWRNFPEKSIHGGLTTSFVQELLTVKRRILLKMERDQLISIECKGEYMDAKVLGVDHSLAWIEYLRNKTREWIYRGSFRLEDFSKHKRGIRATKFSLHAISDPRFEYVEVPLDLPNQVKKCDKSRPKLYRMTTPGTTENYRKLVKSTKKQTQQRDSDSPYASILDGEDENNADDEVDSAGSSFTISLRSTTMKTRKKCRTKRRKSDNRNQSGDSSEEDDDFDITIRRTMDFCGLRRSRPREATSVTSENEKIHLRGVKTEEKHLNINLEATSVTSENEKIQLRGVKTEEKHLNINLEATSVTSENEKIHLRGVKTEEKHLNINLGGTGVLMQRNTQPNPNPDRLLGFDELHKCTVDCLKNYDHPTLESLHGLNPLGKPMRANWERHVVKGSGRGRHPHQVIYVTPCQRRCNNMEDVLACLDDLGIEYLTADHFSFMVGIRTTYHFPTTPGCAKFDTQDYSNGREAIPVSCVNQITDESPPDIPYSNVRIPDKNVTINTDPAFQVCCSCTDGCKDINKCECQQLTIQAAKCAGESNPELVGYKYKLLQNVLLTGIYECNKNCSCNKTCGNRVVQIGLQHRLQLFKTISKGWGIRCLDDIVKGAFVCIYTGKIQTDHFSETAGKELGDEYFADLDHIEVAENAKDAGKDPDESSGIDSPGSDVEDGGRKRRKKTREFTAKNVDTTDTDFSDPEHPQHIPVPPGYYERTSDGGRKPPPKPPTPVKLQSPEKKEKSEEDDTHHSATRKYFGDEAPYTIDAKQTGNLGRYLNHSCKPNLFVQNVFIDTHDLRFPWVAFFSNSVIRAGTELTWDYCYELDSVPTKRIYCYCGAKGCKKVLL